MPLYVFLPPDVIKVLAEIATDNYMSISELVAYAVTEYLRGTSNNDDRS